jgi:hypothetical protein
MNLVKPLLLAALAVALTAYAFDCGGAMTADQAMQCCNSMPCSSHGHDGQDCCKSMPAMHAPFVQPASVHILSYSPLVLAILSLPGQSQSSDSPDDVLATQCHAPPILSVPALLPLRI